MASQLVKVGRQPMQLTYKSGLVRTTLPRVERLWTDIQLCKLPVRVPRLGVNKLLVQCVDAHVQPSFP
jgi:hypothetical protein